MAYYFHWSRSEVMGMSRRERKLWLRELDKINNRITRDTNRVMQTLLPS